MNSKRKYTGEKIQTQTFIVNNPKPLDDRFVIQRRAYLIDPTTWYPEDNDDTNNDTVVEGTSLMAYSGMIVSITDDPIADNNGLYILGKRAKANKQAWDDTDSSTYDADGWKKVDSGQPQVQADWEQDDNTAVDFIKNKPAVPTMRTMNHEQLTDSSLGDINIHDGFYFPNAVHDADGNWYGAVVIGDQVWMGENFRCTSLPDGTPIINGSHSVNGGTSNYSKTEPRYYWAASDETTAEEYGLLYNGAAILNGVSTSSANPSEIQGIAPSGWHIPSYAEFDQLLDYIDKQNRYLSIAPFSYPAHGEHQYNTNALSYGSTWGYVYRNGGYQPVTITGDTDKINATGFCWKLYTFPQYLSENVGKYLATSDFDDITQSGDRETISCCANFSGCLIASHTGFNMWDAPSNPNTYNIGIPVRCVSDLTPIQFRNWYIEQYGSLQHHIVDIPESVQSDWTELDPTSDAYIKNKPIIPTVPNHRTINHEIITYSTQMVDINLHDGYYFPNAVQDYDGNWYGAIILGDQVWLAENLRTKHFADGTPIDNGLGILSDTTPYYIDYTDSDIPIEKRGLLYNWPAVMNGYSSVDTIPSNIKDIAPGNAQDGTNIWHIPSNKEFSQVWQYMYRQKRFTDSGNGSIAGSAKPVASIEYWHESSTPNTPGYEPDKNNSTGFNIYPTPTVDLNGEIVTSFADMRSFFWTTTLQVGGDTTLVILYGVSYNSTNNATSAAQQSHYCPIRCVCDLDPVQFRAWYVNKYGSMQHHPAKEAQANWTQSDNTAPDYIKNKPDLTSFITSNDIPQEVFMCEYNSNNTMDKTPAEIIDAVASGKIVVCKHGRTRYLCVYASDVTIVFSTVLASGSVSGSGGNFVTRVGLTRVNHIVYVESTNTWVQLTDRTLQEQLSSGNNIKTINGVSILGSGDISIVPQPTVADAGKVLIVNAQGQYELVSLSSNAL